MKKGVPIAVAVLAIACGIAAYFLMQPAPPEPQPAQVQAPPPPPMPPVVRQVIEAPAEPKPVPLPSLGGSDSLMLDALAGLIGNQTLMRIFQDERIIRRIVATIDNLPRKRAPMNVMPVKRAPDEFIVTGTEDSPFIGTKNAARYSTYVKVAQVADASKLVGIYVRLYPLFQEAYEELGYPGKYFNDRLIVALDDLLAAPDIKEPLRLVRPGVYYQFADPSLEERSIGQRILIRIGSNNAAVLKAKLREIREELKLHMREIKADGR